MCLPFGDAGPTLSSVDWPSSGMTVDGTCYPLSTWARRTCESGGGFLPTATTSDAKSSRRHGYMIDGNSGTTLLDYVTMFPTPTANEYGTRNNGQRGDGTTYKTAGAPSLSTMASKSLWPTPTASDCKRGVKGDKLAREGGPSLAAAATMYATPTASDKIRSEAFREGRTPSIKEQVGGQLNPTWVEWLMGYEVEWTVCERLATPLFHPKRAKHLFG